MLRGDGGWRAMWLCRSSAGSVSANGSDAGEHLEQRHAQRVQITARIDAAVHPAGLLGRDIGQRSFQGDRTCRYHAVLAQADGDTEVDEVHALVSAR